MKKQQSQSSNKKQQESKKSSESTKNELEEMKQHYLRALADYKNLENRMIQDRQRVKKQSQKEIFVHFLTVLDSIDQAEQYENGPGIEMISESLRESLARYGVVEVPLLGKEFDPEIAEVVEVTIGEQDNIITSVIQKAYELEGEIIRHGKVIVQKRN